MRIIEEISEDRIQEMQKYYDPLLAGICIQKYIETEDGKGDFKPIYANRTFAESMGIPFEFVYQFTLRQAAQGFPDKQLQDMVEVAFENRVIIGDSFSRDYSKYFSVRMYQYAYGYTITFMSDVTVGHINANTLHSVSRAYEEIYYARINEPVCTMVYPAPGEEVNKSYEELAAEILSGHDINVNDAESLKGFLDKNSLCNELCDKDYISKRFRMRNAGGNFIWCLLEVIANERTEGQLVGFTITIKDIDLIVQEEISKQVELAAAYEKVKRANASKDKFLAHMSHDLRTPLNGILGMLQILEEGGVSEEIDLDYRRKIRKATENLLTLFTEVLDITRLDSENHKLELSSLDFDYAKSQIEDLSKKVDVPIILNFTPMAHPYRKGAEEYMRQVVYQLVTNAIKYNRDNNPIEIAIRELEDSNIVELVIKDRGIGIADEFKAHVFEPFAQENGDARTLYEGSGLGLTYVKRILDEMDGEIDFESTKDVGTTFVVRVPLEIDYEMENKKVTPKSAVELTGKKVLIVEDNEINMMVAQRFLSRDGMVFDTAENGKIAVEKFISSAPDTYDLILMDIMMPVMNGLDATKVIRASGHINAKTIPIIGVSANYFPEDIEKGMTAGMNDYLAKPVKKAEFTKAIENVFR